MGGLRSNPRAILFFRIVLSSSSRGVSQPVRPREAIESIVLALRHVHMRVDYFLPQSPTPHLNPNKDCYNRAL